ncbi:LPP leucine zipper domain-containing protein [Vibrio pectenicida]|uniref:LPP leucine zipper domain-containing protein n=1 Tax=Vibrio pectenicida TaxID=62763 RepID=UPI003B9D9A9F
MNKMLIAAAASSVLFLAGCASGPDKASSAKLDELSNQVSQLSKDVQALTSESMSAREEAARANERIDNIAQSYTK